MLRNATDVIAADPGLVERIWNRDPSAWAPGEDSPADRLGWLDLPVEMQSVVAELDSFAAGIRSDGVASVVLLGMGGSSLAPEVFGRTFEPRASNPALIVLDSTHPDQIRALTERLDLSSTMFIVSSKSGGTIETISLYRHFRSLLDDGTRFVAITDAGTSLEELARAEGFRAVFQSRPDIGGRYSALSHFGLVPAVMVGAPAADLLSGAAAMASECRKEDASNPGLALGNAIGRAAAQGSDKLTFSISEGIASFGSWVEQLLAESTGKQGKGIVPIVDEPASEGTPYGPDRFFVSIRLAGDSKTDPRADSWTAGSPVIEIQSPSPRSLGAEMFRWEFATAVAGSILGINAFDQPNVESAKRVTRELLESGADIEWAEDDPETVFEGAGPPELACLLAFAPSSVTNREILEAGRRKVLLGSGVATMSGFGPRYLHSTGQLHKGGKKNVRALVILDPPEHDEPIPESPHTFGRLITSQAAGDARALHEAGQRVARTSWQRFAEWAT
ncbi:MAG: transaldolase / glucose-6-phosphate isomerase [Actinomycetota bacterium]|nr:transaldolase / glucose-6-phosphate isomerase [Actinomycetota bacterium]